MEVPLPSPSSSGIEERGLGVTAQGPNNPLVTHPLPFKPFLEAISVLSLSGQFILDFHHLL